MVQPRIEVKPSRPLEVRPGNTVRVVGSTIIARFTGGMLTEPKPATPVAPSK